MIETPHLHLIPCDDTLFEAIRMGNNVLARVLGVNVPKKWTGYRDVFTPSFHRWKAHPPLRDWWTHLIVHLPDRMLIGSCGYKGEPDADGIVEIGYEIRPSHRERGLATEAAQGLIDHAFAHGEVKKVIAHTLPGEGPSTRILKKLGFVRTGELEDPDDGLVWRWELKKEDFIK
ncbi:GNAT family N-acetyltransferase [Telluribacter sp.]|jgi:RimJ/RimL family protein N-acetyltransferase|uniref:GNAT family N-acetyltransferase n=1 Tax=Telluribacter sp. TaxID=1978767 RepID=UPI002E0F5262|nr:GNAT family N-acetyltransferase [Telluribacter sp.]